MSALAEHIFDTYDYFWVDHKSNFLWNCLATRWRHHHFGWKLEFLAKIFGGNPLGEKITSMMFWIHFSLKNGSKMPKKLDCFIALLAIKHSPVLRHFRSFFKENMDPKHHRGHFFLKRIPSKKFQLKIPIFSQSDGDATWWPNSSKENLTCGQLRNAHRYQKYVWLVRTFFKEFLTYSSQQW